MAVGARGSDRVGATLRGAYWVEGADGYRGVVWRSGAIWYHHRFDDSVAVPKQGSANREDAIRQLVGD